MQSIEKSIFFLLFPKDDFRKGRPQCGQNLLVFIISVQDKHLARAIAQGWG